MTSNITVMPSDEIKPKYTNLEEYLLAEHFDPNAWVEASVRCDEEGRVLLMVDGSEFIIEKLTGDPKVIITTAMKTDFLGYPTTKKMIQSETGRAITRPLTTVLRANLFMNSLSDFAEVKENFIVIHRIARIQRRVLFEIAPETKKLVKDF